MSACAPASEPPLFPARPRLGDRQLGQLVDAIRSAAGIALGLEKREMIEARLAKLARRSDRPLESILREIEHDHDGPAMADLLDVLTTSYTAFFREPDHFDWLARVWLPRAAAARRPLAIWCAAAATGEEPCSIAMTVHEAAAELGVAPPAVIHATDISRRALEIATAGIYPETHLAAMEPAQVKRWFQRGVGGKRGWVRARRELAGAIEYRRHNLLDPAPLRGLDLIFLRNVLIYFDDATQERVLERMREALVPGGFLVIGHAENVRRLGHGFVMHGHTILERTR
jgi:chemotaxis protein methyltransferase CheR